jgi:hypothetical protein
MPTLELFSASYFVRCKICQTIRLRCAAVKNVSRSFITNLDRRRNASERPSSSFNFNSHILSLHHEPCREKVWVLWYEIVIVVKGLRQARPEAVAAVRAADFNLIAVFVKLVSGVLKVRL